jgi:metallo-beta-lactamase class B
MRLKPFIFFFLSLLILAYATFAEANPNTIKPFPPFRIAGNLYYVGNDYAASYLVVTPQGDILINSNGAADVPMIKASVEKLGFKFSDIKILLISHAHNDHDGGSALIKKETGARYEVMDKDVPVVESGGKADFIYANDPSMWYPPAKVERVLHDGDTVKLGDTVLVAHLTPGHTKGCTTWTMPVTENGKKYNVVIVGGPYVTSDYQLVNNKAYPNIAEDYKHTFQVLKSLPCDIFLGAHGLYFGLDEKYARMGKDNVNPFIDPQGYKQFVAQKERDFYTILAEQKAQAAQIMVK